MKNIVKVALVALISTCNADNAKIISGMNEYRARFEHDITTKVLEATKSPELKQIISGLNDPKAKLTGFVLRDIEVATNISGSNTDIARTDILVNLHDSKQASYHIVLDSNVLSDFSRNNTPQSGYYLLTDELKNKINANTQKSDYAIAPLRQEMLQESFKNPGVEFDHVKFLKENQLTREKINKNAVETLTQVNQATEMKQDTYKFATDLFKGFVTDQSVITTVNTIFSDFITTMTEIANPSIVFDAEEFQRELRKFSTEHNLTNNIYEALLSTMNLFERYATNLVSKNALKDQCKFEIFSIFGKTDISDTIAEQIHQNILRILQYTNNFFQPTYNNNPKYNAEGIKDTIQAIKNEVAKIADINISEHSYNVILQYESSIEEFDFSEEIGNAIYLDTMYFALDSGDSENKMKLLDLSRQNKIVSKLFEHDLVFSTSPYSESIQYDIMGTLSGTIRNGIVLNMFLYNSALNSEIKTFLSGNPQLIADFLSKNGDFILTEKWKGIVKSIRGVVYGAELNKLTQQDYLNLYNSLLVFTDSLTMNKLRTLEKFLNVPNIQNQGLQPIPIPITTQP